MVSVEAEQAQGSVVCASTRPNQHHPRQRCRGRHPLWSAQNHQRAIHPAPARSDPCLASVDAASAGSAARTRRRGGGRLSAVGGAEEELFAAGAELVAEASEFVAAFLQFLHQGTEGAPVSEVGHRHPEHRNFTDERRPCLTLTGSTELAPQTDPTPAPLPPPRADPPDVSTAHSPAAPVDVPGACSCPARVDVPTARSWTASSGNPSARPQVATVGVSGVRSRVAPGGVPRVGLWVRGWCWW